MASVDLGEEWTVRGPARNWNGVLTQNNRLASLSTPSRDSLRVEGYPAYGGWPGWDGLTFGEYGGNARHLGSGGNPAGGNVLYADFHVEWSEHFGPAGWGGGIGYSWHHFVFVTADVPPKLQGKEPTW
jgi:prepilin-type processing-associated H-X9-DG protein